jgi:UDP-glucuronate decarboxylase
MPLKEQVIKKSALSPTILIAGGAGFIGSHLAERFLKEKARVIVVDNFRTGKDVYLDSLAKDPNFAFFDIDINQEIPQKIQSVDYIIHLAGVESYLYSRDQVNLDSLLTNAFGTKNLLDLAERSEAKFLLVSSIDVYEGLISPLNLDQYFGHTPEEEKRYSLSEAKRFAEALVWEYYKKNNTDVRIVRLPEIYGPRMNLTSSGALGQFMKDLLENKDLTIYGEGTQKEYYLYITDAITGLVKALMNKNTSGQIYTLAPEEPGAMLETAYMVKSIANKGLEVKFKPTTKQASYRPPKIPDRSNLKQLKWAPTVPMKEGAKKTLTWFGYSTNEHAFKPAKLIEQKETEKQLNIGKQVHSLVDTFAEIKSPQKKNETTKNKLVVPKTAGILGKLKKQNTKPKQPKVQRLVKAPPKQKKVAKLATIAPLKIPTIKAPKISVNKPELNINFSGIPSLVPVIAAILLALTLFVGLPVIQTVMYAKSGAKNLLKTQEALTKLETDNAKKYSNKAFQNFNKAERAVGRTKGLFVITKKQALYTSTSNLLSSATDFSKGIYNVTKAAKPFENLWEVVKPVTPDTINLDDFKQSQNDFREAKESFQLAAGELKGVDKNSLPERVKDYVTEYETTLKLITENIDTAAMLASEIPNLLGTGEEEKTYLVLFQNSNEIRPTGGFIGSYAVVEFQKGKIKNLAIDDIYNPDGQIKIKDIQVAPPTVLGELLEEDRLYIRNANWDPDYTKSAETIADLYKRVAGKQVSGILAVDLNFVENLLRVTGPVYLTTYGEEINASNLYERTQYHSEFNYEDGVSQKRAFLTVLGGKLIEKIFALSNDQMPNMFNEVGKALEEKHLLTYLSESTLSAELKKQGWDGSLTTTNPETTDYLYVVNANVGGTKANYFVENETNYIVSSKTRDGLLRGQLTLNYNHTGTDNAWPGGPYKNYVRALTQQGAKLTNATLSTNNGNEEVIFEKVAIDTVGNYTSFEYLVEVQPQDNLTLTFYYDLPQGLSINTTNKEYELYIQKQPGTQKDKVNFSLEQPFGMTTEQETQMQETLDTDKFIKITLK